MKKKEIYNSPCMTVTSSRLRTILLVGSTIGGKSTGEDIPFGSRERKTDLQTTNID